MLKRASCLLLFTGVAVLFSAALALAQKPKTITIHTDALLPNGQHLKAGTYQVVVNEITMEAKFMQGKKVVATQVIGNPEGHRTDNACGAQLRPFALPANPLERIGHTVPGPNGNPH